MTTINLGDVQVARTLRSAEHAIDDALTHGADYLKQLIERRRAHNLAAEVGHEAIAAGVEALAFLAQARGAQVRSHTAVNRVAEAQGIGWHMAGPLEGKIASGPAAAAA